MTSWSIQNYKKRRICFTSMFQRKRLHCQTHDLEKFMSIKSTIPKYTKVDRSRRNLGEMILFIWLSTLKPI